MAPYVVLHLLPDPEASTTQNSNIQQKSTNPTFKETFYFTFGENEKQELHVGVWNNDGEGGPPRFMGQCIIPIMPVIKQLKRTNRWYTLTTPDIDYEAFYSKRFLKKVTSQEENRAITREYAQAAAASRQTRPAEESYHQWAERFIPSTICSVCKVKMTTTHLTCSHCQLDCHHKCVEGSPYNCDNVGMIRLKIELLV